MGTEQGQGAILLGAVPGFRTPFSQRLDPELAEVEGPPVMPADPEGEPTRPSLPPTQSTPKPDRGDTRTSTSDSTGKPRAADTAKLVAGLLGLVVVGVAAMVKWRGQRELRQPSKPQLDDIAQPFARIAMRHIPAELLNADLADAAMAGAALGAYLNDGPLIRRPSVDAGVPGDLSDYDPEGEINR